MEISTGLQLLNDILKEITQGDAAALSRFNSLRDVDAKIRDTKLVLMDMPGDNSKFIDAIEQDIDFQANSRRVRLEALANHIRTIVKFMGTGAIKAKKKLYTAPELQSLTSMMPDLDQVINDRWLEAQKCQYAGAYLASVIIMGSILEALLLSRALKSPADAYTAKSAPKKRGEEKGNVHIADWTLNSLIDVAVELGWLKTDRGKFSHALRESRNVVHPWNHVHSKANFDEATCKTCWHVLNASVDDLLNSL